MNKFVIVDGNNLMFRAFYALPQLANFDGEISNAVFGFTMPFDYAIIFNC